MFSTQFPDDQRSAPRLRLLHRFLIPNGGHNVPLTISLMSLSIKHLVHSSDSAAGSRP